MDSTNSHGGKIEFPITVNESHNEKGLISSRCFAGSKLLTFVGAHELHSPEMWRAALTELVATAFLMFTLTTSIIACLNSNDPHPKLLVPLVVFVIAFFFLMVTIPLTGGHMNPIFTYIAALKGVVTVTRAVVYVIAQCIGSATGFLIIRGVMDHADAEIYSLGGCSVTGNVNVKGLSPNVALLLEFSCTFVMLFLAATVAFDNRRSKELGLVVVCMLVAGAMALAVFVSITVTGNAAYAGAGLNPVRCFGPALLRGGLLWHGHWVFWLGPFLACTIYHGFSLSLPKDGLVEEGEFDRDCMLRTTDHNSVTGVGGVV